MAARVTLAHPAALGLAVAGPMGCGAKHNTPDDPVEICDNGADDDLDGLTDCADYEDCICDVPLYADVFEDNCSNGVDDDDDGRIDCADSDCFESDLCTYAEYAAPFEDCTDGIDNDYDGQADCDDADCAEHPEC